MLGNLTGLPPDIQKPGPRCGPLPVSFNYLSSLYGRLAFVTFVGRIRFEPIGSIHGTYRASLRLYAEQELDIRNAEDLNGPVLRYNGESARTAAGIYLAQHLLTQHTLVH